MTPPVPSNWRVAHELLALIDRASRIRSVIVEQFEHPDAIEDALPAVKDARADLACTWTDAIARYENALADLLPNLVGDDEKVGELIAEHYRDMVPEPGEG